MSLRNVVEPLEQESVVNGPATPEQASPSYAPRAENYLRLRADEELGEATSHAQVQATAEDRATTAKGCMARVAGLAGALAAVGAAPESVAVSVLGELGAALVQRGLLPASELDTEPVAPGALFEPVSVRAVPVGVTAVCAVDGFGFPVRVRFGALVADGRLARITWRAAYTDPALTGSEARFQGPEPWSALRSLTAADDVGGEYHGMGYAYRGRFREGGQFGWDGWTRLDPAPPAEARWLDLSLVGNPPARIPLEHPREHAVTVAALDPAGAADRYLDARSLALFAGAPERPPGIVAMAGELLAAGVLQLGSPSLARLAAVAGRQGLAMPGPLATVLPSRLPADWAGLLDRIGTEKGASGLVFAAAVLPEVEGARCVITELASRPDISTLQVYAPAWPHSWYHGMPQNDDRYHWDVRDDLGRRYATSAYRGLGQAREAEFPLRLHPPVSPLARELEITLSGRTSQASVRVPLDWQNDDWESELPDWQVETPSHTVSHDKAIGRGQQRIGRTGDTPETAGSGS
ncbi:MAG TPA: hypothetical protein VGH53_19500 [Streptosporangiaceae bacterium]